MWSALTPIVSLPALSAPLHSSSTVTHALPPVLLTLAHSQASAFPTLAIFNTARLVRGSGVCSAERAMMSTKTSLAPLTKKRAMS